MEDITLSDAASGKQYTIRAIKDEARLVNRLSSMGLVCGSTMEVCQNLKKQPVLVLLYRSQYDMAVDAAGSLMMLAFGFIFLAIAQTLTGALQGIGRQLIPVRNLIIGAVFKTVITYMLVGVESLNVIGAAIGTCIAYMIAAVLDIMAVKKYTAVRFNMLQTFIKPIIATLVMSVVTVVSYNLTSKFAGNSVAVLISIILSAAVYAVMLFATRTITAEEAEMLPGGNKLVKIMGKFIK